MKKIVSAAFIILSILIPAVTQAEMTYSDWSAWQPTPISGSDTIEVQTRIVDFMGSKTQYSYDYWRYYNNSAGRYFYKGNGNLGGTYYSVILDYKMIFFKSTSDGNSYWQGSGKYINFSNELWFNEKEVQTPVVTGQQTEYRYRTKSSSAEALAPVTTPAPVITPLPVITPNPISTPTPIPQPVVQSGTLVPDKQVYLCGENINLSWTPITGADSYSLHISNGKFEITKVPNIFDTKYQYKITVEGPYKVWVTAEHGNSTIFTFNTVETPIKNVLIEQENMNIIKGYDSSLQLQYLNDYVDLIKVSYKSSDQNIATVDSKGNVTAKNIGQAVISVMYSGKNMDACTVSVKEDLPRLPIDISLGKWFALTYPNHDAGNGGQYSAVDWNLPGNKENMKEVYAIQSGTVCYSRGGRVVIKHDKALTLVNGYKYDTWYSSYSHMKKIISINKHVNKGDVIGYISKVNADYIHLHFAIYKGTKSVIDDAISPYWLPGDYNNMALYADDDDGTRIPEGLYERLIFRPMPE